MLIAEPSLLAQPKSTAVDRAQYKALGLSTISRALRALSCEEKWAAFIAALPDATRAVFETPPPVSQWVALRHVGDALDAAGATIFNGDANGFFEVGRRSFAYGLKLVYKVFIRFMHPEHSIARAAQMWDSYYKGNGSVRCEQLASNRVRLHVQGVVIASPAFWQLLRGANFALIEAAGLSEPAVDIIEGGGHAPFATLQLSWR